MRTVTTALATILMASLLAAPVTAQDDDVVDVGSVTVTLTDIVRGVCVIVGGCDAPGA